MSDDEKLKDDIVGLQKNVAQVSTLVDRFDKAIDKLTEVSLNVTRLLAVHEQRIDAQEKVTLSLPDLIEKRREEAEKQISEVYDRISSTESGLRHDMTVGQKEILLEIKDMRSDMNRLGQKLDQETNKVKSEVQNNVNTELDSLKTRLGKLERWSWLVLGGATAVGFLASQASNIVGLLS